MTHMEHYRRLIYPRARQSRAAAVPKKVWVNVRVCVRRLRDVL